MTLIYERKVFMKKLIAILLVLLVASAFVFVGCAKTCPNCFGTGECQACVAYGSYGQMYKCSVCYGSGICRMCSGDGKW